ncbi:hypothetical protein ACJDU8_20345 [Clostridium sp. WILCCON 0269]|uniref:DUF4386 domain-containing protein n=1 Tax=Candidatus Clostridium eludens TaxID=3381663 RepID=A0ABW8SQA6_9CLOT
MENLMGTNAKTQRLCAWAGVLANVLWVVGEIPFTHWWAPHSPLWGPSEVAKLFQTNTTAIVIGLILFGFGGALYLPWTAEISVQLKRIEGKNSPLTYVNLGLGACFVWVFLIPWVLWQVIAFRASTASPEILWILDDLAWITNISPVNIVLIQGISIGIAVLSDKHSKPIFPRWFGWYSIASVFSFLPGAFSPLFETGPIAWDGLLSFWIPFATYLAWMTVTTVMLLKAIKRQEQEELSGIETIK